MNVKGLIGMAIVAGAGLGCGVANAGGVSFGINVGVPVYAAPVPVYAAPVYAPPPPPPPVVYQPAYQTYQAYQPAPVVVAAAPAVVIGWHGNQYWDGHRYWNRRDWYSYHGGYGYRRW